MTRRSVCAMLVLVVGISLILLDGPVEAITLAKKVDWAVTCRVNPDVELGFYKLDRRDVSSLTSFEQMMVDSGKMPWLSYHHEYDGDYVGFMVYIDHGGSWTLDNQTQIVFCYSDTATGERREVVSRDILFIWTDPMLANRLYQMAVMDREDALPWFKRIPGTREVVYDPDEQDVILKEGFKVDHTKAGALIGWARFDRKSLPRPHKFLFFGGNPWGWIPPDYVEVRQVSEGDVYTLKGGE